jgi:hypothetical protein
MWHRWHRYVREAENEQSELEVELLSDGKVHVKRLSLWGINREYGPHTGELDFVADIRNRRIKFSDDMGQGQKFELKLIFGEKGLTVKEQDCLGYFGLNVSFEGEYRKQ